jgi:hypothetical protein
MSQKSVANSVASSPWQTETLSSAAFPSADEFQYEWLEGSTQESDRLEEIRHNAKALFEAAKDQHFEDGMESDFSNELVCLIEKHSASLWIWPKLFWLMLKLSGYRKKRFFY